ncbi:polysaccharide deacetylase [Lysinibacillus fusiformis]|jgi:peptidoglycan/xylan/chitin deacetylase (PgdA/CDA1 family)|uniref:polysaccharide deacetylase family protein n=1 Tax=Lysinibacillus TaxID=400634 RepID=UPI0004DA9B1C|nr:MULTISPECIES: polysaccharide deacetylase family protein [Lysinibacillus]AJK87078.1 polysaccharide deacetylase [Lysinibacillus fusiformis]KAB0443472.1 polysaccharide deacetylase [Lysinibacillus fusiformis]KHK55149.1 polysaccharide deacetylase [Lysinibacillus sp. A1]QDZ98434.1 polysaccharide deacetylase [Lysinibacillus fusiformis]UXJ67568.1 polysaccharide deacetylase family protein [Lysinibacillus fusiformis]
MKRKLAYSGIVIVVILAFTFSAYKLMNARKYQLFGNLTSQVETNDKVVALTFDDGPTKNTDAILSLLDDYQVKATFFLIGKDIEGQPEEARKIAEAGHQIGNHTYSHKRMVLKSPAFIKHEIEKTDDLIADIGYTESIVVRPPYGKKLIGFPYYLNKHKRETITWNLEPDTFFTQADEKVRYVKENIRPGSIILMHPMYDSTGNELQAIEKILQTLMDEGYTFVTIDELLTIKND